MHLTEEGTPEALSLITALIIQDLVSQKTDKECWVCLFYLQCSHHVALIKMAWQIGFEIT